MGVQDGLHDVLEPHALPNQLLTAADLPPQCPGPLVRHPDLRQEATGVELGQHRGIDAIGLDLGVGDQPHLLGVGNHHPSDMGREHRNDGSGVAGRLHDHVVVVGQGTAGECLQLVPAHANPAQPCELAIQQGNRLGEDTVNAIPMTRMAPCPPPCSW
jgi:hypothetical protein